MATGPDALEPRPRSKTVETKKKSNDSKRVDNQIINSTFFWGPFFTFVSVFVDSNEHRLASSRLT